MLRISLIWLSVVDYPVQLRCKFPTVIMRLSCVTIKGTHQRVRVPSCAPNLLQIILLSWLN
jgi:hypothetical protein